MGDQTDEGVQLQIIKALLTAVTSSMCAVHENTLLKVHEEDENERKKGETLLDQWGGEEGEGESANRSLEPDQFVFFFSLLLLGGRLCARATTSIWEAKTWSTKPWPRLH
jgi:hypothetical protein